MEFPEPRPEEMGEQVPLPLGISTENIIIYTEFGMRLVGSEDWLKLHGFRDYLQETHGDDVADKIWHNLGLMGF